MLLREFQVIRDLLCLRGIPDKSLNRMLQLLILKTSHRKCSVKKSAWKSCQFHRKIPVLESFLIHLQAWRPEAFLNKKRLQQVYFSSEICEIFESTYFEVHLWTSASLSSGNFIYNAWKRYSWRGVIRILSNIYDGVFWRKQLTASLALNT